ncbi:MAG: hypothetical protein AAFP19_08420, partial [Bacteroidota bacterium]
PIIYSLFDQSTVRLEDRNFPVDVPYPFKEQFVVRLLLPEGYQVEEIPASMRYALTSNGAEFNYLVDAKDDMLRLVSKMHFRQTNYQPDEFGELQQLLDISLAKFNEQVVLKRAEE